MNWQDVKADVLARHPPGSFVMVRKFGTAGRGWLGPKFGMAGTGWLGPYQIEAEPSKRYLDVFMPHDIPTTDPRSGEESFFNVRYWEFKRHVMPREIAVEEGL
jgi:hypothetical protein